MAFTDGPFVQAACLCELTIQDKTGPLSLIKIIDTITHTTTGPNPPENLQPFTHNFNTVGT
jgi:mannosyltransferase OCH1-like enzyme